MLPASVSDPRPGLTAQDSLEMTRGPCADMSAIDTLARDHPGRIDGAGRRNRRTS
jgi:hypothetical protein